MKSESMRDPGNPPTRVPLWMVLTVVLLLAVVVGGFIMLPAPRPQPLPETLVQPEELRDEEAGTAEESGQPVMKPVGPVEEPAPGKPRREETVDPGEDENGLPAGKMREDEGPDTKPLPGTRRDDRPDLSPTPPHSEFAAAETRIVIENPPLEMTDEPVSGDQVAARDRALPGAAVDDCLQFRPTELTEEMRVRTMEGPIRTSFMVEVDGYKVPWVLMSLMKMPGSRTTFQVASGPDGASYTFLPEAGEVEESATREWTWKAPPEPGAYCLRIQEEKSGDVMCFHTIVLVPYKGEDSLNGYRIGSYQPEPLKGNPRYLPPQGLIEVREDDLETWVSPHFQLKQFLCKQESAYPKYMLLETSLLVKLELLVEELATKEVPASGLYIVSGYRTPHYNKSIGNETSYSRHLFGDAADLFVDYNGDGKLDDLDENGQVDDDDAALLHATVAELTAQPGNEPLVGGLGFYPTTSYRDPFIHVDTRGYSARWPASWAKKLKKFEGG